MIKAIKSQGIKAFIYNVFIFLLLIAYCLSLIYILFWMVTSAMKSEIDYALNSFGLPDKIIWNNFVYVFTEFNLQIYTDRGLVQFGFVDMFVNSISRSTLSSFMLVLVITMVAYVLARYKFVGNRLIYTIGIFVMVCPVVGNLPSAMLVRKALGVYDNFILYIITSPYNIFGLHFLIMYSTLKGLPSAYSEAASMDGANHYQIMFKIIMPLIFPTIMVLFVLNFLVSWNDYMLQLTYLPSYPNLAYGMYRFQIDASSGASGVGTPIVLAGFTVVMIPTIILYLSMQGLIVNKLNVGGIKG